MSASAESEILAQLRAMRADLSQMSGEMAELRHEVAALRAAATQADPVSAVRRLWDEGLASGVAGDLDEVFDGVVDALPRRPRTM